jgi:hypothetical protein
MTICGSCGKVIADNIPLSFRVEGECKCSPQDYAETVREALLARYGLKERLLGR